MGGCVTKTVFLNFSATKQITSHDLHNTEISRHPEARWDTEEDTTECIKPNSNSMKKVMFIFNVYKSMNTLCKSSTLNHTFPSILLGYWQKASIFPALQCSTYSAEVNENQPSDFHGAPSAYISKGSGASDCSARDVIWVSCFRYQIREVCVSNQDKYTIQIVNQLPILFNFN